MFDVHTLHGIDDLHAGSRYDPGEYRAPVRELLFSTEHSEKLCGYRHGLARTTGNARVGRCHSGLPSSFFSNSSTVRVTLDCGSVTSNGIASRRTPSKNW